MVPFGRCPTVPAGEGIQAAWLQDGSEAAPAIFARASRLTAVSMDMTAGYAKSVREHAPHAPIVIDNYHVVQVRHEALPVRAGCKTPPPGCRGSPVKLRTV
jgi:transposase